MDWYRVILRALHVLGGAYWAGSVFFTLSLPEPGVENLSREGLPKRVTSYARASRLWGFASLIALATGLLLYWQVSGGLNVNWITSPQGLTLTIGGLAGLATFFIGALVIGRNDGKMEAVVEELESSRQPATQQQVAELQSAQQAITSGTRWSAILLVITVLAMASSQFVFF